MNTRGNTHPHNKYTNTYSPTLAHLHTGTKWPYTSQHALMPLTQYVSVCVCVCRSACVCPSVHACMHACTRACVCAGVCMCRCVCRCVCACTIRAKEQGRGYRKGLVPHPRRHNITTGGGSSGDAFDVRFTGIRRKAVPDAFYILCY